MERVYMDQIFSKLNILMEIAMIGLITKAGIYSKYFNQEVATQSIKAKILSPELIKDLVEV